MEIDEYGNVLQAAQIVYGRNGAPGFLPAEVQTAQGKMHITYSRNNYTNDILDNDLEYRLRIGYESISCELYIPYSSYPDQLYTKTALLGIIDPLSISDYSTSMAGINPLLRLLANNKTKFRENDASTPLPFGEIETLAIPHEQYTLAFSDDIIASPFTDAKLEEGEYIDLDSDDNYWVPSGQVEYGAIPEDDFYSVHEFKDPWGNTTSIEYWDNGAEAYWLLPKSTTDAVNNTSTVDTYDWRILQPTEMTDINGNQSEIAYDALGMPVAMAVKGKSTGTPEGDNLTGLNIEDYTVQEDFWTDPETYAATLLGNATMRCVYDLSVQPTAVAMIGREIHYEPLHGASNLVIRITYTDGFGRVAMHKVQAADEPTTSNPRWIGSGKTVYNNKGKTVLQYEPYFSATHAYDPAEQAANLGVSARMHYDAMGRVYRTDMPDGTFSKTIWDGWMQVVYDGNDTSIDSDWYTVYSAGSTEEQDAANKAAAHYNTPTIMHLDSLARPFYTVQLLEALTITEGDKGLEYDLTGIDHINSYENLDITGNRLSVVDGRGNTPLTYTYNLLKVPMQQISIDSGTQYMLADVGGQPLYAWDADNREFHFEYDVLRRPTDKEVTYSSTTYKIEETIYGEGITIGTDSDTDLNLRGQVYCQRDNAGEFFVTLYDFKGLPKTTTLELIDDHTLLMADWAGSVALTGEVFTSSIEYDALGRPISNSDPGGNVTENTYDKGGMLKKVFLTPNGGTKSAYVSDIHYDSKGRREAIWYGNGTKTAYEYDGNSYRLTRVLTTKSSNIFQDLNYFYDAVGNITTIKDEAQEDVWFANTIVTPENKYTYDSLYRLVEADGRERKAAASFGGSDNTDDSSAIGSGTAPWDGSSTALQHYTQYYEYDEVGNILSLQHSAGTGSYTRNYNYSAGNSRLNSTDVGINNYPYTYDSRGNMITMPHLSTMVWNPLNELQKTTRGTTDTYFNYSGGERIRKVAEKSGGIEEHRIYLGSYEIYRKFVSGSLTLERTTVHISDDTGRIAMLEERTVGSDASAALLTRYIYSNHLQSAMLELDENADIISYEEYHPFGTTAYQASNTSINAVAKRYRYTGKERDEETGLYYHGARYYIPWLARWSASDPMENKYAGTSPYNYSMNNPVMMSDPSGADPQQEQTNNQKGEVVGVFKQPEYEKVFDPLDFETGFHYELKEFEVKSSKEKDEPFSMLLNENPSISENLPWGDLIGLGADKFEQNYDRLMDYTKSRNVAKSLGVATDMTDNQFGRFYDAKLLKNSVGSIALKSLGTTLEAVDFVKSGMNMNKGVQGDLTVPMMPQMMPLNVVTQMIVKDKAKEYDLMFLKDAITKGSNEVSNQLNNSGLGNRLNLTAGFADSSTMQNILQRGEVDFDKDHLLYIKYLGPKESPDMGSRKFPFLIVHPKNEQKTKDFFIIKK